ncbi:M1 family peptidase [Sphingobacterium sp. SRCM116780]|uniref:M1 family aminopeptidase n=1 Tax=Sphingobacterium sp. SRCM116780 TaxID=2907623 RepID=UPI001F4091B3|nr:M1 family aminopeptidase [Sphingobacterium sp. SRCM116780]UIR55323.1 M1 family peptidase [Sphingobacterium sp. SRCM116780]
MIHKIFFTLGVLASMSFTASLAQTNPLLPIKQYRVTETKVNDLIHTKLDVKFDYVKRYLYGQEWVTLKPHFYPTDSLRLDAKGMDIKEVSLQNDKQKTALKYEYDSESLLIHLGKTFQSTDSYTIYIAYTAKPDELKAKGSAAITDAKGLYFINPDGKDPNKPIQIWTQGETEASSVWFPTIDKPSQKTTSEISITVKDQYTTLSNGALTNQQKNADGTRTDTWKMTQAHSPYLFMMAVGDFKIFKDQYKSIPVDYYLEPKYAPFAKQIFGKTPDMMAYYSQVLGVEYPWNKYAQVVARDYVSGAMENTTATLHGESVQKTTRELLDDNQEGTIAHELFHQWFGDLVTAESWSNLTMNESFATFGEVIWRGHDGGQDKEDKSRFEKLQSYLRSTKNGQSPTLARFYYNDKEDMFDNISYSKGSIILYALKNQMGDTAFYKSLQKYLTDNAHKAGETHQLRLAMEEVTGKDWNPYFNQWYYQGGHPILDIQYTYENGIQKLAIKQIQDSTVQTFTLPLNIDFYTANGKETRSIVMNQRAQEFTFPFAQKPDFIDFDPAKILVGEVRDNKTQADYSYQYKNVPTYFNRSKAIGYALYNKNVETTKILIAALDDKEEDLRAIAIQGLDLNDPALKKLVESKIIAIAQQDPKTKVRASAIFALGNSRDQKNLSIIEKGLKEQSYAVISASLLAIKKLAPAKLNQAIESVDSEAKEHLASLIASLKKNP